MYSVPVNKGECILFLSTSHKASSLASPGKGTAQILLLTPVYFPQSQGVFLFLYDLRLQKVDREIGRRAK